MSSFYKSSRSSSEQKNVIELTDDNFQSQVLDSNDIYLVNFYAPWCGYSKQLLPNWEEAAGEIHNAKLGNVDATVHKRLARKYNITSYPTIKIFKRGKAPEEYRGPRDTQGIVKYVANLTKGSIKKQKSSGTRYTATTSMKQEPRRCIDLRSGRKVYCKWQQ